MLGFKMLSLFVVIFATLAMASPIHLSPLYIYFSNRTYVNEFYVQGAKIQPGEVRDTIEAGRLTVGNQIAIAAIHATISALPDLHVQIWLEIDGQGNLFRVNSGSLGTANSDLSGIYIIVDPNTAIVFYYWCDNLAATQRDFHASITIFYLQP